MTPLATIVAVLSLASFAAGAQTMYQCRDMADILEPDRKR